MRKLPPLKTLPVFELVAKYLSISKAADELCVTHSAVSQTIKHLEGNLNVILLKRDKRNMELTPIGKEFLLTIKNGLDNIENGMIKLQRQTDPHSIAINMPTSFATAWFVPQLNEFETQYPDYRLTINTPAKEINFNIEPLDAAIYFGNGHWSGLIAELLFPEIIFPVCKPDLIKNNMDLLDALKKHPIIVINSPHFKDMWPTWCQQKNMNLPHEKQQLYFDHPLVAIQAAKKGLGIMLSNQLLAKPGLNSHALVCPFKESMIAQHNYYFVYPEEYKNEKKLQIFSKWIKTRPYDKKLWTHQLNLIS